MGGKPQRKEGSFAAVNVDLKFSVMDLIRMQVIKKLLSELSYDNKTRENTSKHYISIYPEKL